MNRKPHQKISRSNIDGFTKHTQINKKTSIPSPQLGPVSSEVTESMSDLMPSEPMQDSKPSKVKKKLGLFPKMVIVVILLLSVLIPGVYAFYVINLGAIDPGSHQQVEVKLPVGSTAATVAATLKERGLIRNSQVFELYVKLRGVSGKLQAGVYRIAKSSDVPTIVSKLTAGEVDTFTITFLPGETLAKHRKTIIEAGYSMREVDAALAKQYNHPLLKSKPASADLEGYIYGETYNISSDASVEDVLTRSFDEFYKVVQANSLEEKFKERGLTLHQGVIMASIIQREVGSVPKDGAMVSGVFYNRLAKGMNLGSDVTYQYIADKTGVARDPKMQSEYNTRIHTGLPPGPIASPGKGALLAAASPTKHEYLFFLSGDDNITYFGITDADHESNIREHCQKKCQIL